MRQKKWSNIIVYGSKGQNHEISDILFYYYTIRLMSAKYHALDSPLYMCKAGKFWLTTAFAVRC
jgi:hypothetical protein